MEADNIDDDDDDDDDDTVDMGEDTGTKFIACNDVIFGNDGLCNSLVSLVTDSELSHPRVINFDD